jgi:hypothetical protein
MKTVKLIAQLLKTPDSIEGAFPKKNAPVKLWQQANAKLPMFVMLPGMVTLVKALQP